MRSMTMFGMLLLATVLLLAVTCAAQPGGSYRQTCRDVSTHGSTLRAECQDGNGGWRRSELSNYQDCTGDIQNIYGQLQCSMNGNRGDNRHDHDDDDDNDRDDRWRNRRDNNGAPRGSYYETCRNIRVDGDTLRASCEKKNGKWRDTSLNNYRRCNDIENINGKLRCNR
jgi:CVNH domain-containing protein